MKNEFFTCSTVRKPNIFDGTSVLDRDNIMIAKSYELLRKIESKKRILIPEEKSFDLPPHEISTKESYENMRKEFSYITYEFLPTIFFSLSSVGLFFVVISIISKFYLLLFPAISMTAVFAGLSLVSFHTQKSIKHSWLQNTTKT